MAKGQASSSDNNNNDNNSGGAADDFGEDGVKRRVLRSRYLAVKNLISGTVISLPQSLRFVCICVCDFCNCCLLML